MRKQVGSSFWRLPSTRLGWWAVGLEAAYQILSVINSAVFMRLPGKEPWQNAVLPYYGIFMMLCGLGAGVVGLVALIRCRERSWLVWLVVALGVTVVLFLLGEFLIPH